MNVNLKVPVQHQAGMPLQISINPSLIPTPVEIINSIFDDQEIIDTKKHNLFEEHSSKSQWLDSFTTELETYCKTLHVDCYI